MFLEKIEARKRIRFAAGPALDSPRSGASVPRFSFIVRCLRLMELIPGIAIDLWPQPRRLSSSTQSRARPS
jgi:hypothetical protein